MCAPIQRSFEAAVRVREFRGGCGMELWDLDGLGRCTTDILLLVLPISSYFYHISIYFWVCGRLKDLKEECCPGLVLFRYPMLSCIIVFRTLSVTHRKIGTLGFWHFWHVGFWRISLTLISWISREQFRSCTMSSFDTQPDHNGSRWTMASGSVAIGSFEDGTVGSRSDRRPPCEQGLRMDDFEETSNYWMAGQVPNFTCWESWAVGTICVFLYSRMATIESWPAIICRLADRSGKQVLCTRGIIAHTSESSTSMIAIALPLYVLCLCLFYPNKNVDCLFFSKDFWST